MLDHCHVELHKWAALKSENQRGCGSFCQLSKHGLVTCQVPGPVRATAGEHGRDPALPCQSAQAGGGGVEECRPGKQRSQQVQTGSSGRRLILTGRRLHREGDLGTGPWDFSESRIKEF